MRVTSQRILSFFSLLSPCRIFMPCSGRSSTRYTPLAGLSWLSSAILSSNLILLALECWTWLTGIGHNLLFLTVTAQKKKFILYYNANYCNLDWYIIYTGVQLELQSLLVITHHNGNHASVLSATLLSLKAVY